MCGAKATYPGGRTSGPPGLVFRFRQNRNGTRVGPLTNIFEGQQGINSLLHLLSKTDERSQRTPVLGFVGSVSRSLFGTATVGDVQRVTAILNNVVDRVNQQSDATSAELRLLHVAVNRTGTALDTLKDATSLNSRQIMAITNSLRESYKSINRSQIAIQSITRALNRLTDYVTNVADRRTNIFACLLAQAIVVKLIHRSPY